MDADALRVALVVGLMAFVMTYVVLGGNMTALVRVGKRARTFVSESRRTSGNKGADKTTSRRESRQRSVRVSREMPGFLDVVTLGLSAGLSFDSSLELYCKRCNTELSRLLWDCLLLWRIGARSRQEALEEMASELDVPSMTRFVSTVCEALAFGTPLSATLERQAKVIRDEQRSLMEEEIERVPVKMLIPLGTLIVPAMLLAILGPLLGPAIGMA